MSMTPKQAAVWAARAEGKSFQQIALEMGLSRRTVRDLLDRARKHQGAVSEAMEALGLTEVPQTLWIKNKSYSAQIRPSRPDFITRVREAFEDIPPAPPIPAPDVTDSDLLTVYPLFDVHHGLRAHARVSGTEMDASISVRRIIDGLAKVMGAMPQSDRAVILNGGDFTHQTDDRNETRRSGHRLDVAGRNFVTVCEAVEVISASIEMALTRHRLVEYASVPGNHDPQNWETIQLALRERYRHHDRVTIRFHMTEFTAIEHGEVALFVHHGDKRTPKDLAMFCAAEYPEVWGRTRFRVLMTGHLHHIRADEFPGIYWMQMPAVSVRDHHAAGGYKSNSLLMGLAYDRTSETIRHTVRL